MERCCTAVAAAVAAEAKQGPSTVAVVDTAGRPAASACSTPLPTRSGRRRAWQVGGRGRWE